MRPSFTKIRLWLLLSGGVLVVLLAVLWYQASRPPYLDGVYPRIASPGEVLVIEGRHFGSNRGSSQIFIAGTRVTQSRIIEWTPQRISLRVPDSVQSGLITLETNHGQSNGLLFANRAQVPRRAESQAPGSGEGLESNSDIQLEPVLSSAARGYTTGALVTVKHPSIPDIQGNGAVYLPDSQGENGAVVPQFWMRGSVGFFIPTWARSGDVTLKFPGREPVTLTVPILIQSELPAVEVSHQNWMIHYGLETRVTQGQPQDKLIIRVPLPPQRPYQRIHEKTETISGLDEGWRAVRRVAEQPGQDYVIALGPDGTGEQPIDLTLGVRGTSIGLSYEIDPGQVSGNYQGFLPEVEGWDRLDRVLHPHATSTQIQAAASRIVGRQSNPYRKVQLVFDWLAGQLEPGPPGGVYGLSSRYTEVLLDPSEALEDEQVVTPGSSRDYASLGVDLLRAGGVPARMIDGFLVLPYNHLVPHAWIEYFLPGLGWIPADPALMDGMVSQHPGLPKDSEDFYRRGIDAYHILLATEPRGYMDSLEHSVLTSIKLPGIAQTLPGIFYTTQGVRLSQARWKVPYLTF
ncbi:transglutaminase domain-containing protein [Spirochaeta lutea]|uniref:Transglutaminase-like domain-containing protein n=1 Tax=Spirochaeta lutea TaxID=1480694 RepID=A0A098QSS1_9SPIO|nr:transglutaminase domain-containing protein [Spirochaeta lutea]KGE70779.1 hypothetical protein DC28_14895 [Spirochaeta lutea]